MKVERESGDRIDKVETKYKDNEKRESKESCIDSREKNQ